MSNNRPVERDEHVWHGLLLGILEVGKGFEQVHAVVGRRGVLGTEPREDFAETVRRGCRVEIHKIAATAAARDCVEFHAGDIARIGHGEDVKLTGWKE